MPRMMPTHRADVGLRTLKGNRRRVSAAARGYGRAWERLSRIYRRRHPMCADPFGTHAAEGVPTLGDHVDHVVALSAGGTHAWENLQTLCRRCHSRKTALHDGGFGRARMPPDR